MRIARPAAHVGALMVLFTRDARLVLHVVDDTSGSPALLELRVCRLATLGDHRAEFDAHADAGGVVGSYRLEALEVVRGA